MKFPRPEACQLALTCGRELCVGDLQTGRRMARRAATLIRQDANACRCPRDRARLLFAVATQLWWARDFAAAARVCRRIEVRFFDRATAARFGAVRWAVRNRVKANLNWAVDVPQATKDKILGAATARLEELKTNTTT